MTLRLLRIHTLFLPQPFSLPETRSPPYSRSYSKSDFVSLTIYHLSVLIDVSPGGLILFYSSRGSGTLCLSLTLKEGENHLSLLFIFTWVCRRKAVKYYTINEIYGVIKSCIRSMLIICQKKIALNISGGHPRIRGRRESTNRKRRHRRQNHGFCLGGEGGGGDWSSVLAPTDHNM